MKNLTLEQQRDILLEAIKGIVNEVMNYPPTRPYSADSYLPTHLIVAAQAAIEKCHTQGATQ